MLLQVTGGTYGPRFGAYKIRVALETAAKRDAMQRAAAARNGVPVVQNSPPGPGAGTGPSAGPLASGPVNKRGNGVKPPPYAADVGLSLEGGSTGMTGQPLEMIVPDGGFTN